MKTRTPVIACCMVAAALSAGCAAVYKNTSACEQTMRQSASELSGRDTLKVTHAGSGIHGSRVVVEGTLEHPQTASEAAVAKPPNTNIIEAGLLAPLMAAIEKTKPPTTAVPAAAECTYDANGQQSAFRWLAPARLAKDTSPDDETHTDE
ncbi:MULTISPECIES: hypothetical protein [Paraburkholderia]|uniref:Lipoprotein n=1 Tax=Paraburkholderia largidicola TaxID=3014751 RepID=A0A7I8BHQ4_9BURK|nr:MULTISPECIES: hypothetical protein [Paraburkholderia]BCF88005.1 hypothetical protein PPGU16_10720 [Paraburkholderia sp. PGU16]BEU20931.1 hypothetical protein PBP221_10710 [Paraburkholderia sp. 22B1P]GJH00732.1 hypothetical protein CBA19C8_09265 [Paraburkholderia terrae]GJH34553.1 hypothetical protein CBA19CS91_17370 [Paraburkholderia hospita]